MTMFVKVTLYFMKKRTPTYKVDRQGYNNYFISFRNIDKPDIRQNDTIMANVIAKHKTKDCFVVSSKISNSALKELLMAEYQLSPKQVQVTQGNLFV